MRGCQDCRFTLDVATAEPLSLELCQLCRRQLCDDCMRGGFCPDGNDKRHVGYEHD